MAGTLATTNGGTGLTSFTANGVVYASSTSALATGSSLVWTGSSMGVNTSTPDIFSRGYGTVLGVSNTGSSGTAIQINSGTSSYPILELGRGGTRTAIFDSQSTKTEFGNLEAVPLIFYTNSAESARIDSSGNVGIGTSSPEANAKLTVYGAGIAISKNSSTVSASGYDLKVRSSNPKIGIHVTTTGQVATLEFGTASDNSSGAYINVAGVDPLRFGINGTEAGRFDSSGNLLVGATSQTQLGKIFSSFNQSTNQGISLQNTNSNNGAYFVYMLNSTGGISGSISQSSASTVLYNSTSDYRLKSNVTPVTTGLSVINQLNPVNFTWIPDNKDDTGFLAHEFQAIIPRYVVGVKDAVDSEGNPIYQQMDNSGTIPYLVSAIKELKAINDTQAETINALTARIVALEAK